MESLGAHVLGYSGAAQLQGQQALGRQAVHGDASDIEYVFPLQ